MTYSNNINADKELCRYELAGGICNDDTCEFQHFRTMSLAGALGQFKSWAIPLPVPTLFVQNTDL
jgi:hypothetical protein